MSTSPTPRPSAVGRYLSVVAAYSLKYAFEILVLGMIVYLCVARGLSLSVDIYDPLETAPSETVAPEATAPAVSGVQKLAPASVFAPGTLPAAPVSSEPTTGPGHLALQGKVVAKHAGPLTALSGLYDQARRFLTAFVTTTETDSLRRLQTVPVITETTVAIDAKHAGFNEVAVTEDPAPHISNLTLVLSPDYAQRKNLPADIVRAKKARVQNYIRKYLPIAKAEMRESGIPVSITLAQGLLESNAGDSKLARVSNNHFGIKCRKKCLGCTCRNYGDDTRYDMFRVFESPAESFKEHSRLLNTSRYAGLKKHGIDYKKWAHGLKKCGYATDKRYGDKLIAIIEELGLDDFDV